MKVSELTGAQLDYWVAKALATIDAVYAAKFGSALLNERYGCLVGHGCTSGTEFQSRFMGAPDYAMASMVFVPSSSWQQAGPIIERERISTLHSRDNPGTWDALVDALDAPGDGIYTDPRGVADGPTLLIAAMRAFVVSKFGNEVSA